MKMSDIPSSAPSLSSSSPSSQGYMSSMKGMHDRMMVAIRGSDLGKVFAKGMVAHHEGAIAAAGTKLEYGRDPETGKFAQDIIKAQKGEIERMNTWFDNQK